MTNNITLYSAETLSDALANTGVIPGMYGSNTIIPIITVEADGRIHAINNVTIAIANNASTTQNGIVQLNDTVTSNSITLAATANSVNTATQVAQVAQATGVSAFFYAVGAFNQANAATNSAQAAFNKANSAGGGSGNSTTITYIANSGLTINGTSSLTITGNGTAVFDASQIYNQANAAFIEANSFQSVINSAFSEANAAINSAQAAFNKANSATTNNNTLTVTYIANSGLTINGTSSLTITGNGTAVFDASQIYNQANAATNSAQAAYNQANAATNSAQAAFNKANSSSSGPVPAIQNDVIYVSTQGSDSNNGLTWATAVQTLGFAMGLLANGAGNIFVGAGTYTLSSAVQVNPGVQIYGMSGTIITRGNGSNLSPLINFDTNTASNAAIYNCIVDGNRLNNTLGSGSLIYIGKANNVTIKQNVIKNSTDLGVYWTTGNGITIIENDFEFNYYSDIYGWPGVPLSAINAKILNNRHLSTGGHALIVSDTVGTQIRGNQVKGVLVTGFTVTVTATTVTASSPIFSSTWSPTTVCPGQFIICNGGGAGFQEILITGITSSTVAQCTGATAATAATAVGGSGDLMDLNDLANFICCENILDSGTGGIVPNSGFTSVNQALQDGVINNNVVKNIAGSGLSLQTAAFSQCVIQNISLVGNILIDCLQSPVIYGNTTGATAIISVGGTNYIANILIDSQRTIDDTGSSITPYWLSLSGVSANTIAIGTHFETGMAHSGVNGTGGFSATIGP